MKNFILSLILAVSLVGCSSCGNPPGATMPTSPWCKVVQPFDTWFVNTLVANGCTNGPAMMTDIQATETCQLSPVATEAKALALGPISVICSTVAPLVVPVVLNLIEGNSKLLIDGQCPASIGSGFATQGAAFLCGLIPGSNNAISTQGSSLKIFRFGPFDLDIELPEDGINIDLFLQYLEDFLVDQALTRTGNNCNAASKLLRLNRTTLVMKRRKRGMVKPRE